MRSVTTAICLVLAIHTLSATADDNCADRAVADWQSPKFVARWESQHARIGAEIERLPHHEWAGTYYFGDGLGVNALITMAPTNGFDFVWHGCLGVYDRNLGTIQSTDSGTLRLYPELANHRCGFQGFFEELVPVTYDGHSYLVPANRFTDFLDEVREGRSASWFRGFWLHRENESPRATEPLTIPQEFRKFVLDEVVTAKVVAVSNSEGESRDVDASSGTLECNATIDAGKDKGLVEGMWFRPSDPEIPFIGFTGAKVVSVGDTTSRVVFQQENCKHAEPRQPQVGWIVRTGGLRTALAAHPASRP